MTTFMIRFLFCNIFISLIILILFGIKHLLKHNLTQSMQYNLWLLFLGLLAVPFIPVQPIDFLQAFSRLSMLKNNSLTENNAVMEGATVYSSSATTAWMNDFAISINKGTASATGLILLSVWLIGIFFMLFLSAKSWLHLRRIKKSALPLQNKEVRLLYNRCLTEMGIQKAIPVYSTAFLKSPIIVGAFKPCIYLPIHLISDYNETDMRYMLFHELQHYKRKDSFSTYFMNIAGVLYWFNPLVWLALKEMRNDREIACDTSVLALLNKEDYTAYGHTLIHFAEKVSKNPFPFTAGISGTMKQLKKRIINIAAYENPSALKKLKSGIVFTITAILFLSLTPTVSTYGAEENRYHWNTADETISYIDLSAYFADYEGSFVLYDLENHAWSIYNMENATLQVSPNSTYKIYDALFGLEAGVITVENSQLPWNQEIYSFDSWNRDQNLQSAMTSSVNWYFQAIDEQLGADSIYSYLQEIHYGNASIQGDLSTYWMESSLKISPVEQVMLLTKLYNNSIGFHTENIDTVKNAIYLTSSQEGALYGKTGTGRVNGEDVNGWFVGYVEGNQHTYLFAVNIQGDAHANGSHASEIALSILSHLNIWE